jgi:hypothetical protein
MPSVSWPDVLLAIVLIGCGVATYLLAPEFLNVVLPVCAASLIGYVSMTRR